jgi:class 3 adenylate cyclase
MSDTEQSLVVMFVDISGSTRLFSEYGNERALALTSGCMANLRSIIDRESGTVVQTFGDGILCTFPTADSAFQAAIDFRETQRNQEVSIHAGFHYGPVIIKEDSIYGDAVNLASRLADKAKKEEIILSEDVMVRLSPRFRESTRSLRNRVFVKGKDEPMKMYKMISEDEGENTAFMSRFDMPVLQGIQLELIYQDQVVTLNELDSDFVVGRLEECDLLVLHSYASRRHATIDCKPGKFNLADHSSNGSFVQDEQRKLIPLNRDSLQLYGSGVISLGIEPDRNPEHIIQFRIFSK